MLQSSIRNIRENKNRHEQRMEALDLRSAQLDYQMNDPRIKLERQKAAQELEVGRLDLGQDFGQFNDLKKQEFFNRYTKPEVNEVLGDHGIELNADNQPVMAGTNTPVELSKYQRDAIEMQVSLGAMSSRLGHNELDMNIEMAQESVTTLRDTVKGGKTPNLKYAQANLKTKEERLNRLTTQRDDPTQRLARAKTAKNQINKIMLTAATNTDIPAEYFTRLKNMSKIYDDEIASATPKKVDYDKVP